MINTLVAAAAAAFVSTPAPTQPVSPAQVFGLSTNDAPSVALAWRSITSNIACRSQARNKLFELGARDMSDPSSNSQWGTLGNVKALVWCRDDIAIIAAAGHSFDAASEARDALYKAF